MTISFNCECCKKKIKAPDKAGGKWGACPNCQHRCYIPMPKSDDEPELKLAPVDENELSHIDELMKETYTLTQKILHEDTMVEESPQDNAGARTVEEKKIISTAIVRKLLVEIVRAGKIISFPNIIYISKKLFTRM